MLSEGQKTEKQQPADRVTAPSGLPPKRLPANSARSHDNASNHKTDEERDKAANKKTPGFEILLVPAATRKLFSTSHVPCQEFKNEHPAIGHVTIGYVTTSLSSTELPCESLSC